MTAELIRRITRAGGLAALAAALAGCNLVPVSRRAPAVDPRRAYVDARTTLLQAVGSTDPKLRTHALEALAATAGPEAAPVIVQALRDNPAPVLFAAAMAAGDTRSAPARKELLKLAAEPRTPPKLKCAVIYALHRLGDDTHTGELGKLLQHRDKFVRGTVAMVMGRMGQPSAIRFLKTLQRNDRDPVVQLQVVEALAELGDERSLVLLEAFTKSRFMEDRIIAVRAMGRIAKPRSLYVLRRLAGDRKQEPAVRVAAAGSLAKMNRPEKYDYVLRAATDPERILRRFRGRRARVEATEISSLQTLAVMALADMGRPEAADAIYPLLKSSRGPVRMAACKTILTMLRAYRPAKVKPAPRKPPVQPTLRPRPTTAPTTEPATGPATRPATAPTTTPATGPATRPTTRAARRPTLRPALHVSGAKD